MRAAVLGRPVAHSLSPAAAPGRVRGARADDWTYDALDVGAGDLPVLLAGLGRSGGASRSRCRASRRPWTSRTSWNRCRGCCTRANTLIRTDAGWRAENTDVSGIGMALQLAGVEQVGAAAIVGAGGTAAAAAVALASLGASTSRSSSGIPPGPADVTRVLDALGVPSTVVHAGATPSSTRRVVVSTVPMDAQPDVAGAALAGRADRARRPLRELAHPAGASA